MNIFPVYGKREYEADFPDLNLREVYRYLGYRQETPEPRIEEAVQAAKEHLERVIRPKAVFRSFPLKTPEEQADSKEDAAHLILEGAFDTKSRDLMKNLQDCRAVILFAATLGPGPDLLIRRAGVQRISDSVILQAVSAEMIEEICNRLNEELRVLSEKQALRLRPRYSPGYGDLSLEVQKNIIQVLNAQKEIGLSLTEGLLMTPGKSVTALIGVQPERNDHENSN